MISIETIIALLVVLVLLALLTRRFFLPFPVVFTAAGIILALVPEFPPINLNPHLIFSLFVPPVLFFAAYFTSWRDFCANIRPISLLALVLVTLTTFAVAVTLKFFVPILPWAVCCVLGAIVAPPDAITATAITSRLKIPRRIITIIEGESLVNDASALIIYKFALAAVITQSFSLPTAALQFLFASSGGIALGFIIGWAVIQLVAKLLKEDAVIATVVSLVTPFATYIIAEKIPVSGVLAVVTAGLVVGWNSPKSFTPVMRTRAFAVWETFIFVINGSVFMLMGLQLPYVLKGLQGWAWSELLLLSVIIIIVMLVMRLIWIFFSAYGLRAMIPAIRRHDPYPPWQSLIAITWAGMRGIVSLGAALAIPFYTKQGQPFPARDLIIFMTFLITVITLFFQGISFPWVIKLLGLREDPVNKKEELLARQAISQAMLDEINKISQQHVLPENVINSLRQECYHYVQSEIADEELLNCLTELQASKRKILDSAHEKLIELRRNGMINDSVMHAIQTELDLDRMRLTVNYRKFLK